MGLGFVSFSPGSLYFSSSRCCGARTGILTVLLRRRSVETTGLFPSVVKSSGVTAVTSNKENTYNRNYALSCSKNMYNGSVPCIQRNTKHILLVALPLNELPKIGFVTNDLDLWRVKWQQVCIKLPHRTITLTSRKTQVTQSWQSRRNMCGYGAKVPAWIWHLFGNCILKWDVLLEPSASISQ